MTMKLKNVFGVIGATAATMIASSSYAVSVVSAGVTTQLGDAQADVIIIGGAILAIVVVVAAFKMARKAL
jgi:hypothetical protein